MAGSCCIQQPTGFPFQWVPAGFWAKAGGEGDVLNNCSMVFFTWCRLHRAQPPPLHVLPCPHKWHGGCFAPRRSGLSSAAGLELCFHLSDTLM